MTVETPEPGFVHHFTPWLLLKSKLLSTVLGLDIELESREFTVGPFSLDLIGKELSTGSTVIIENQYGPTDHTHLGQVLTYAGGTHPTTVVWIAEQFARNIGPGSSGSTGTRSSQQQRVPHRSTPTRSKDCACGRLAVSRQLDAGHAAAAANCHRIRWWDPGRHAEPQSHASMTQSRGKAEPVDDIALFLFSAAHQPAHCGTCHE